MSGFTFFSNGSAGGNGFYNNYGNDGDDNGDGNSNQPIWDPIRGHYIIYSSDVNGSASNVGEIGDNFAVATAGSNPRKRMRQKQKAPRQNSAASKANDQNTTDPVDGQTDWSLDNLPDILYQFRATTPRPRTYDQLPTKPSPWGDGRQLRIFSILPDRISTNVEEFRVEAWMRLDRRIQLQDITDRMNPAIRVERNALQQRGVRFRHAFRLLSWGTGGKGTAETERQIAADLVKRGIDPANNSTRGLTPGLINPALGEAGGRIPVPPQFAKRYQSQATPAPPPPPLPPSSLAQLPPSPPPTKRRRIERESLSPDILDFNSFPKPRRRFPSNQIQLERMPLALEHLLPQPSRNGHGPLTQPQQPQLAQTPRAPQAPSQHVTEDNSASLLPTPRPVAGKRLPGQSTGAKKTLPRPAEPEDQGDESDHEEELQDNVRDEDEDYMRDDNDREDDGDDSDDDDDDDGGDDDDDDDDDGDFEFDQNEMDEEDHEIYDNQYSNNNNQEQDAQDNQRADVDVDQEMRDYEKDAQHDEVDQTVEEADQNQQGVGFSNDQQDEGNVEHIGESSIAGVGTDTADSNDQYAFLPDEIPEFVPDTPQSRKHLLDVALGCNVPQYCNQGHWRMNDPMWEGHIQSTFWACRIPYVPDDPNTRYERMEESMQYTRRDDLDVQYFDALDQFYAQSYDGVIPLNSQQTPDEEPFPWPLPDDSFFTEPVEAPSSPADGPPLDDMFEFLNDISD